MKKVDAVIKTKILGYFNKHKLDKLYLNTFINEVGYKNAKYSDLDILNFLCDYLIEIINSDKQSYNLIQKLVLFIYDIFCQLVFEKKVIREDVYKKVLNTEVIFNKYVDENNLSKDEFVVKYINKVNELIEKSNKTVVNMSNVDENGDIKEKTNKTIKKEEQKKDDTIDDKIKELEVNIRKISKDLEKQKNKTTEKKEKIKELNKQVKELEKKINHDDIEKGNLYRQIENLLSKIKEKEEEIIELNKKDEENNSYINELLSSDEYCIGKRKSFEDKIDIDILNLIYNKEYSIHGILQKYPNYSYEEIQESLGRIGEKFTIESQDIVFPKKFKVQKIVPETKKKLSLKSVPMSSLDIMFISDLHVDGENTDMVLRRLSKVYDYCTNKGINTVINLGDFLEGSNNVPSYEQYKKEASILDKIINDMPLSPTINHFILGGNHEDKILCYGLDPLKYISSRRDDIINFGYYDALLELSYKDAYDYILLHHKGIPTENRNYTDDEKILKMFSSSIRENETKGNSCFQLFGHLHRARIDTQKEYAIVPSLTKSNEYEAGALHAKIYFDVCGNVNNILFIHLSYNNGLKKSAEISYKKQKKYK